MVIKVPKEQGRKYCVTVIDEVGRVKTVCGSNLDKVVSAVESLSEGDVEIYFTDIKETPYGVEEEKESMYYVPRRQKSSTKYVKREVRREEGFF